MYDLVIAGGTVVDGTGAPRRPADVAVVGDRIVRLGRLASAEARRTLDAGGCIVAPGFIDTHNHLEGWLLRRRHLPFHTMQGFTSHLLMSDGISYAPVSQANWRDWLVYLRPLNALRLNDYAGWQGVDDYLRRLDRRNVQNAMALVPFANLRVLACGWRRDPADDTQIRIMQRLLIAAMEAGAAGLSTGLDYVSQCFARTDEIVEVCRAMAPYGGVYVTHVRYKRGLLPALHEAVAIARQAEVPVHISHLKAERAEQAESILEFLDRAGREVNLSFEFYPYGAGSTLLSSLLPYEAWENGPLGVVDRLRSATLRQRFQHLLEIYRLPLDKIRLAWTATEANAAYRRWWLSDYVAHTGRDPADALADLLIEEQLAVLLVFHLGGDELVEFLAGHPAATIGSDGIFHPDAPVHPRVYGTAAKILGTWVRQRGLLTLEQAVRQLAGFPAERFGFRDRGQLREGALADLVIFDPQSVQDHATYDQPHQLSTGIRTVIVNGTLVVDDGQPCPPGDETALCGRALSRGQAAG